MWQQTERIFLDSCAEVLRAAARVLPSVLAMLLFFALAVFVAVLVRWIVRRACERLRLDQRLREWGVSPPAEEGRSPPSRLVAAVSFWSVLLAGALLGTSVVNAPGVASLSMRLVEHLPGIVVALFILGAGVAAARFAERSTLIGAVNLGLQSARLVALAVRWLVVLLAAAIALEQAGVGTSVITVTFGALFGGVALAFGLAVGLGAKDAVARAMDRRLRDEPSANAGARPEPGEGGKLRHL
jgi:hypothetical protein